MSATWVVLDSSVVLAYLLPEPLSQQAHTLLATRHEFDKRLAAPPLLQYEVIAVLRKNVFRNLIMTHEAVAARDTFFALMSSFHFVLGVDVLRRGFDFATQLGRPTAYDSQYLAVAEHLKCEFWTADERLYNATRSQLTWVRWLGNVES